jgi:hypothetical protein
MDPTILVTCAASSGPAGATNLIVAWADDGDYGQDPSAWPNNETIAFTGNDGGNGFTPPVTVSYRAWWGIAYSPVSAASDLIPVTL